MNKYPCTCTAGYPNFMIAPVMPPHPGITLLAPFCTGYEYGIVGRPNYHYVNHTPCINCCLHNLQNLLHRSNAPASTSVWESNNLVDIIELVGSIRM